MNRTIKKIRICLLLIFSSATLNAQQKIALYQGALFPFSQIDSTMPTLTPFVPKGKATGIAVIVCSGGSYGARANAKEGIPACERLSQQGITAFLLDYRLPGGHDSIPFADAQRAIRYLKTNASKYHLHQGKIGIMGFSAGGHLAATVSTHFNEAFDQGNSALNLRPDFAILVYPVISMIDELTHSGSQHHLLGKNPDEADKIRFSNENQVSERTPPVFIVHAVDDGVVKVANSLYFAAALHQHKVPVETFFYAQGGHGFGVENRTAKEQWTGPCIQWIKEQCNK